MKCATHRAKPAAICREFAKREKGSSEAPTTPGADLLSELRALRADLEAAVTLIRELVSEVRGLAKITPNRPVTRFETQLVPVLAATVQHRAFSAREVAAHAAVDLALRSALEEAGFVDEEGRINARQLGKWLRRVDGLEISGVFFNGSAPIATARSGAREFREFKTRKPAEFCNRRARGA